jgi:outer membrane biosynthesis protein TonB
MRAPAEMEASGAPTCALALPAWLLAGIGALALHAGGAAAVMMSLAPDADVALGAPAIEIGVELASPRLSPSDLPPGPEAESALASPAMPEQKAQVEEAKLDEDKPVETEDPERLVTPEAVEKPKPDDSAKATVTNRASEQSIASEAAAAPATENAPEAERSLAPAQGSGDSAQRIKAAWQKELLAHINRFKRLPGGRRPPQRGGRRRLHARSRRARRLRRRGEKFGRCRLRRGGPGDDAPLRPGAEAAGAHRR